MGVGIENVANHLHIHD